MKLQGFTLVEVTVALALLSVIALGLTNTLVSAQQARTSSERWMLATQLAAEGIEQLRAGHALAAVRAGAGFDRSGTVAPWNGHLGLSRIEVTVTWSDGGPRRVQLITLARQ